MVSPVSVCLSVCLSVMMITQILLIKSLRNCIERLHIIHEPIHYIVSDLDLRLRSLEVRKSK